MESAGSSAFNSIEAKSNMANLKDISESQQVSKFESNDSRDSFTFEDIFCPTSDCPEEIVGTQMNCQLCCAKFENAQEGFLTQKNVFFHKECLKFLKKCKKDLLIEGECSVCFGKDGQLIKIGKCTTHIVCYLVLKEIFFSVESYSLSNGIEISKITKAHKRTCNICFQPGGFVWNCACSLSFHPYCGFRVGLTFDFFNSNQYSFEISKLTLTPLCENHDLFNKRLFTNNSAENKVNLVPKNETNEISFNYKAINKRFKTNEIDPSFGLMWEGVEQLYSQVQRVDSDLLIPNITNIMLNQKFPLETFSCELLLQKKRERTILFTQEDNDFLLKFELNSSITNGIPVFKDQNSLTLLKRNRERLFSPINVVNKEETRNSLILNLDPFAQDRNNFLGCVTLKGSVKLKRYEKDELLLKQRTIENLKQCGILSPFRTSEVNSDSFIYQTMLQSTLKANINSLNHLKAKIDSTERFGTKTYPRNLLKLKRSLVRFQTLLKRMRRNIESKNTNECFKARYPEFDWQKGNEIEQFNSKKELFETFNDCSVCLGVDDSPIVVCDSCGVGVHTECYGVKDIPRSSYFCNKCSIKRKMTHKQSISSSKEKMNLEEIDAYFNNIKCVLCLKEGGAMKKVGSFDSLWAHSVCIMFSKKIHFTDYYFMEVESKISEAIVSKEHCKICQQIGGEVHLDSQSHFLCSYFEGMQIEVKSEECNQLPYSVKDSLFFYKKVSFKVVGGSKSELSLIRRLFFHSEIEGEKNESTKTSSVEETNGQILQKEYSQICQKECSLQDSKDYFVKTV